MDIVERLKSPANTFYQYHVDGGAMIREAAEAIESLRKQVRDLNNEAMELAPIIHSDGVYMGAAIKRKEIDELKAEIAMMREAFKEINVHMRTVDKYGLKRSTIDLLEFEAD